MNYLSITVILVSCILLVVSLVSLLFVIYQINSKRTRELVRARERALMSAHYTNQRHQHNQACHIILDYEIHFLSIFFHFLRLVAFLGWGVRVIFRPTRQNMAMFWPTRPKKKRFRPFSTLTCLIMIEKSGTTQKIQTGISKHEFQFKLPKYGSWSSNTSFEIHKRCFWR